MVNVWLQHRDALVAMDQELIHWQPGSRPWAFWIINPDRDKFNLMKGSDLERLRYLVKHKLHREEAELKALKAMIKEEERIAAHG